MGLPQFANVRLQLLLDLIPAVEHVRYSNYRRLGVPIGSGVTEAACKTVSARRLELSGMRWKKAGAQTILTLRAILLRGIWAGVFERILQAYSQVKVRTPAHQGCADAIKPA
jgi:hypothetical protein